MLIIPAIDIIGGQCVRLTKGVYSTRKIYDKDPLKMALDFEKQGADMIHIVDLDAAKEGTPKNMDLILKIRSAIKIPIQVGGGIRDIASAEKYLKSGINRIIIGTKAVWDQDFLIELLKRFPKEKIVISVDVANGLVATQGWQACGSQSYRAFAEKLKQIGISEIICTDTLKDGTLTKPNFALNREFCLMDFNVIAAGGVSDLESVEKLKMLGCGGAILGKALYEKKINIVDALRVVKANSALTKRIIPCLDVKAGRVVKGVNFQDLRDSGDPLELGKKYSDEGADELVFLDIAATRENRLTILEMVSMVAKNVFIPFTVGGGIKTVDDVRQILKSGADKIAINSAAVLNPDLISQSASQFGSQCVVVSVDVKKVGPKYKVFVKGGFQKTDLDAVEWCKRVEQLGAGEIMLTSMERDGTKTGFDLEILRKISETVNIPVIASGGAGSLQDLADALNKGKADAVLAASIFHYGEHSILEAKRFLQNNNLPIRL